jgi:hypothetical protein
MSRYGLHDVSCFSHRERFICEQDEKFDKEEKKAKHAASKYEPYQSNI